MLERQDKVGQFYVKTMAFRTTSPWHQESDPASTFQDNVAPTVVVNGQVAMAERTDALRFI